VVQLTNLPADKARHQAQRQIHKLQSQLATAKEQLDGVKSLICWICFDALASLPERALKIERRGSASLRASSCRGRKSMNRLRRSSKEEQRHRHRKTGDLEGLGQRDWRRSLYHTHGRMSCSSESRLGRGKSVVDHVSGATRYS
jgi:hypothetical protein